MKPRLLTVAIAMLLPSCNNATNSHPDYRYCFVSYDYEESRGFAIE